MDFKGKCRFWGYEFVLCKSYCIIFVNKYGGCDVINGLFCYKIDRYEFIVKINV